jgi:NADH dehydrogenase
MNKILILGGTGLLGTPVARRLRADGLAVCLLARDPGKARAMFDDSFEIVAGDVTDAASLEDAMTGCTGVHMSIAGPAELPAAQNVAVLAPGLGLERITYVSGATVSEENRWFPMTAAKLAAEEAIRACSVPFSLFCPTWPMEMLPRYARGGQPLMIGDQPLPVHWFAADDMARMVSDAYQREDAANKKLFVYGPEVITTVEALERYCRAFHPDVESVTLMPIEAARGMAASTGNPMLGFFAELMAYFEKVGEPGNPAEANELLGAPRTTLDAWIEQRKAEAPGGGV